MRKYHYILKHIAALLLLLPVLLLSCTQLPDEPSTPPDNPGENVTRKIFYRVTVGERIETRASRNARGQYIFEKGDQLYVTSGNDLFGILSLVQGDGATTATFEGDLMCVGNAPEANTSLSAILVSENDEIHTCQNGKVIEPVVYPTDQYAMSFEEAIRKYSHFTGTGKYGDHAFELEQHSSFLIFSINFKTSVAAGSYDAVLFNNNDENDILRSSPVSVSLVDLTPQVLFVAAFPENTVLNNAAISFKQNNTVIPEGTFIIPGEKTLLANRFYNINRSQIEEVNFFTIQAKEDNTTVTFKYTGSGIQYLKNGTGSWQNYNSVSGITLQTGEYLQFRGQSNTYNTNGKPLFEADKTCFIYGDLMSLVCDDNYDKKSTLVANAFQYAFKNATWIDIPSGRTLKLTATTLNNSCYKQMFMGCTSLHRAPVLPATDVPSNAYESMFAGCTSLQTAPDLPAIAVGAYGYLGMFKDCTSLENAPASLPVATSGTHSFEQMFYGCTSLINAPELPLETVKDNDYYQMFSGCSSLVTAPALLATTLGDNCYQEMFKDCILLTTAPSTLPATTLKPSCYQEMFAGCEALIGTPSTIAGVTSAPNCYLGMFQGCVSLSRAPSTLPLTTIEDCACQEMFSGCTSLLVAPSMPNVTSVGVQGCLKMFENCSELTTVPESLPAASLSTMAYKQMFLGCAKVVSAPNLNSATSVGSYCYQEMFKGCRRLVTPPAMPNKVADYSCWQMFAECSNLVIAPELPATQLAQYCYYEMFLDCTSLATPPALPATTMVEGCYHSMFEITKTSGGLTTVPALPATTLAFECYREMFKGCKSITKVPANLLPATTLAESCYRAMFEQTGLIVAPVLPATNLATTCYRYMFNNCTSLNEITCLATDLSATDAFSLWVDKVSGTGTFIVASGMQEGEGTNDWKRGTSGIPQNWTVKTFKLEPIFPEDPFNPEEDL